jgi:hypothetical protein
MTYRVLWSERHHGRQHNGYSEHGLGSYRCPGAQVSRSKVEGSLAINFQAIPLGLRPVQVLVGGTLISKTREKRRKDNCPTSLLLHWFLAEVPAR